MTQMRTAARTAPTRRLTRPQPTGSQPTGSIKLTGRGAAVSLFAASLLGQLIAAWTGWSAVADVLFLISYGLVAYYTRKSGLRIVVIFPPLAFLIGSVFAQLIAAPDTFSAAEGIWVTLATSAPWLFLGTALVIVIALGRGYRPRLPIAEWADAFRWVRGRMLTLELPGQGERHVFLDRLDLFYRAEPKAVQLG